MAPDCQTDWMDTVDLNVGGHVSLGRDPRSTVARMADEGFGSIQIFASSPGAWKPPMMDPRQADDLVLARREHGIEPLFIHAIYLINLASSNPGLVRRSKASLVATMRVGEALRAAGIVTHIGSHAGRGFPEVADQVAGALWEILEATAGGIDLILENSTGAGGIIGAQLSELGELLDRAGRHPRLKVALDTAHLHGAGWDLERPEIAQRLIATMERECGDQRLVLVHANDSKAPLGSRKDRHANIGEGYIGLEGFRNLLAQPALRRVPWILETPDLDERVSDMTKLRALSVGSLAPGIAHAT